MLQTDTKTGLKSSPDLYKAESHRAALRETLLLVGYHLRLLRWRVLLLSMSSMGVAGAICWLMVRNPTPLAFDQAHDFSLFIMESGIGIIAAGLASSLLIGDPGLELSLTLRDGVSRILLWRSLLILGLLLLVLTAFYAWTRLLGIDYGSKDQVRNLVLVWLTPILCLGTLGFTTSLLTRNLTLGATLAILPIMAELFAKDDLQLSYIGRLIFIPYTEFNLKLEQYFPGNPGWLTNRLSLLGISMLLILWNVWWLRSEEHVLESHA